MVILTDVVDRTGLRMTYAVRPLPEVRWVAASDLADPTPFLQGGELVLTTGLGTEGWTEEWHEYASRLVRAGVGALGIATGLTHAEVPAALLEACRAAHLSLVEVPREVCFVDVSRVTAELVHQRERRADRALLDRQRMLVASASKGSGVDEIIKALAGLVEGGVALLDRRGVVVCQALGPRAELLDIDVVQHEIARLRTGSVHAASSVTRDDAHLEVQPVGWHERPDRYLAVATSGALSAGHRATMSTALALLGLAIEGVHQRSAIERELRGRAVRLLLSGEPLSARVVLGATPGAPPLPDECRIVRSAGSEEDLDDGLAHAEARGLLAARVGRHLIVVATGDQEDCAEGLASLGLRVGVGPTVDLEEARRSFRHAGHALQQATSHQPVAHWDRVADGGALGVLDAAKVAGFASTYLGDLGEPLRETLESFVRNHGSIARIAEELGLHRNTVRPRIAQLEQHLGASLDDPRTRAEAWIALQYLSA